MTDSRKVFADHGHLHRYGHLRNQIGCARADEMRLTAISMRNIIVIAFQVSDFRRVQQWSTLIRMFRQQADLAL